jgi:hypothetical protein
VGATSGRAGRGITRPGATAIGRGAARLTHQGFPGGPVAAPALVHHREEGAMKRKATDAAAARGAGGGRRAAPPLLWAALPPFARPAAGGARRRGPDPARARATILRLFHAEQWKVGTIAQEVGVHHTTVRRVLAQAGLPGGRDSLRRSIADPFVPFLVETLRQYPRLRASRLYAMVRARGYPGRPDNFRAIACYRPRPPAEAIWLRTSRRAGAVDWAHFGTLAVGRAPAGAS